MILWKPEAMVIRIGTNKQILTANIFLLFFALTVPGYQGSEIDNYARMQRDLGKYARVQRNLFNYDRALRKIDEEDDENQMLLEDLATHDNDGEKEEVGKAVPQAPSKSLFNRTPLQQHKVNTRSGMRLRRLRRSDEGPKNMRLRRLRRSGGSNMRLRRLRRSDGEMDIDGFFPQDVYVAKRPNYQTTLRSAFDEIMSNSICTVAGRLVPCIREPSSA